MSESKPGVDRQGSHARCATNVPQDPRPGTFPGGLPHLAGSSRNTQWGSRDLNPGPTDYECDRIPRDRLKIGRFVRGSLTLADPAEQRFSLLCATNVPHDLLGCSVCHLRPHRLVGMEASSTVGSSQDNRVSGIWKLTARLPSTPSTCGSCMTMVAGTE